MNDRTTSNKPPAQGDPFSPDPDGTADGTLLAGFVGRLGRDALRYLIAVILPAALGIAGVAVFTRVFPPGPYGRYSLVMAVAAILIWIVGGWLQQSVIRYLPRYSERNARAEFMVKLNAVVWAVVVLVAVVSVATYLLLRGTIADYRRFYLPGVALVLGWFTFLVYNAAFQASLRSSVYARYQVAYAVARFGFSLLLVFTISRDVVALVVGAAAAYGVLVVPMMAESKVLNSLRAFGRSLDLSLVRKFAAYGLPFVGWSVAIKVLDISDRFMIAMFRGADEVGIYSANYNLAIMVMGFVASPILLAAHPLIVSAWEQGNESRIQEIIGAFSRYFLLAAFPLCAFFGVFARQITAVAFGEGFREGFVIIPFVLAGLVVWNFGLYGHKGIKLVEKTGVMFLMVTVCALANLGLNLLFVPLYGYVGAAVTTLISYALYPIMVFWATKPYLRWVIPWRSIRNIAIASSLAAGFWLATGVEPGARVFDWLAFIGVGALGIVLYAGVLWAFGEPREYEKRYFKSKLGLVREKSIHRN